MEDNAIIELYRSRNEDAIRETGTKYGKYLYKIAYNILGSNEDSDECVNDTYMKAWETIPPNAPARLSLYLGAITRNIAIGVFRKKNTASRGGAQYAISLEELAECVSDGDTTERSADMTRLGKCISDFLRSQSKTNRIIFVCRYYYNDSIGDIAGYFGYGESKVKSALHRTRTALKEYLIKEGFDV